MSGLCNSESGTHSTLEIRNQWIVKAVQRCGNGPTSLTTPVVEGWDSTGHEMAFKAGPS